MGTLADAIEEYLKARLIGAGQGMIEIRRCDLAERFECVPSQINYVLETRFTAERGYLVESRRGGGGFIRIVRVSWEPGGRLGEQVLASIGQRIGAAEADELLTILRQRRALSAKRAAAIRLTLARELQGLAPSLQELVRARLLKAMLRLCLEEVDER